MCECSGTLGVGFYGNEEMKKGDNSMYAAASEAKVIVSEVHVQVHLDTTINNMINSVILCNSYVVFFKEVNIKSLLVKLFSFFVFLTASSTAHTKSK